MAIPLSFMGKDYAAAPKLIDKGMKVNQDSGSKFIWKSYLYNENGKYGRCQVIQVKVDDYYYNPYAGRWSHSSTKKNYIRWFGRFPWSGGYSAVNHYTIDGSGFQTVSRGMSKYPNILKYYFSQTKPYLKTYGFINSIDRVYDY